MVENLDSAARKEFDRKLSADPEQQQQQQRVNPYEGGPNKNVMALMAAARMPQSKPFTTPGNEWRPGDKRDQE